MTQQGPNGRLLGLPGGLVLKEVLRVLLAEGAVPRLSGTEERGDPGPLHELALAFAEVERLKAVSEEGCLKYQKTEIQFSPNGLDLLFCGLGLSSSLAPRGGISRTNFLDLLCCSAS